MSSHSRHDAEAKPAVPDYTVEPVPKVPHKIGWRWAIADIIRIVFLGGLLALVIVARKPCSDSVGAFVDTFSDVDAGVELQLERLTPEQIRERFGDVDTPDAGADQGAPGAAPGTSTTRP